MKPYAELLEFNQPNPIRKEGFTRIRDAFIGLSWLRDYDGYMYDDPERIMEFSGRWDYGENNARKLGEMKPVKTVVGVTGAKAGPIIEGTDGMLHMEVTGNVQEMTTEYVPIIRHYIGMGHESMIEMGDATFFIECSRVVSHELVRHRIASFQQESQRFVKYDDADEDMFYVPEELSGIKWIEDEYHDDGTLCDPGEYADEGMKRFYEMALTCYKEMRKEGVPPQVARYVLPNAMRTRLIMKTNIREWRHIIRLRLDKSAQPEMQELMQQIYDQLVDVFPNAMSGVIGGRRAVR